MIESGTSVFPVAKGAEYIPQERFDTFLRLFTHDVRNDLNAIDLLASCAQEVAGTKAAIEELANVREAVRYSARRMVRIANVLQPVTCDAMSYSLRALQEDFAAHFRKTQPQLFQRVLWNPNLPDCPVSVDIRLVFEALSELVENAIAFSAEDSEVKVSVLIEGDAGVWSAIQTVSSAPKMDEWGREPFISTRRGHYGIGLFRARKTLESQNAELDFSFDGGSQVTTRVRFSKGRKL